MTPGELLRAALRFSQVRVQAVLMTVLLAALLALRPSLVAAALWVLAGFVGWILFEYPLHRFVLHARPPPRSWPRLRAAHANMHWNHHQAPLDLEMLFISHKGCIALLLLAGGAGDFVGGPVGAVGVAVGFGLGIVQYGLIHLATHTDYVPRTWWLAMMKRAHLRHHMPGRQGSYGVTTPFIDLLAGTWLERDERTDRPAR